MSQTYQYRAARADGGMVRGRIEAATASQVMAQLLGRGLHPVEVVPADPFEIRRRPAPKRELAVVFRGIASLVAAGVPLERALASTEALARGKLRECLGEARTRLGDGSTLAQAMRSEHGTIPNVAIGMLRAGERSGRLSTALEQVAEQLEFEAELASRLRHALAYPALLVTAGFASMLVIGTVVVPKFAALLQETGQELPPATRVLLVGSSLITRQWPWIFVSAIATCWTVATWLRRPSGRLCWHRALLVAPALGRVRHDLVTARITRALSGGLEAGMPLLAALEAASESSQDSEITLRLGRVRERVAGGETLTSALTHESAISSTAIQLVAVGESSGQLAAMAGRAGDLAAREAARSLVTLVGVLEPALVILLGGFVAFVAAALLQAVYGLRPGGA